MFYCTVRQFAELLSIPIGTLYKAINNGSLRPIPGTQPYLLADKQMNKYCLEHSSYDLISLCSARKQYFESYFDHFGVVGDHAMPTFSFNDKPVKEYKIASPSRKQYITKFENKRTKVHIDHMGSTGSRQNSISLYCT